ncbi:exodeoxyribonuclease V subunit alpha [Cellulomonas sp. SLBN-39]|uniref:exodeoxyribonuclease V subunit alpha n=1 Tax=Cellulomonas sp. SLBN-39 TaxID=2768446 RepID=UPI00115100C0|nr:exodeoxyribonuclease V subunit alpha [Cellulomonas sp. SLBN-39]TQL03591.1 DNA helicase/exodeoxyribonuclease V alpha subunit [Cellulomonas sp. SLBN-39]
MSVAPDPGDPRVPWRTGPLLGAFAAAGVLTSADVRVAERLGALAGEDDERVHLAVACAVRAVRAGSSCVVLADLPGSVAADDGAVPDVPWPDPAAWADAVRRSVLVADGPAGPDVPGAPVDRPLRLVDDRLYLDRWWRDEQVVRRAVDARLAARPAVDDDALRAALDRHLPGPGDERQRQAAEHAARHRLTLVTGGPGTGKTTAVARVLAVLHDVVQDAAGPVPRVALAAPTRRAAARLAEAVHADLPALAGTPGGTLHALLGLRPGSPHPRHDPRHPLPHDVVVVDEASMVSLPLLARLLDAVRPDARLVLVGDPDQLTSVEVGAVLGDLVAAHDDAVVRLTVRHRFGTELGALADAVRAGDDGTALALLHAGGPHATLAAPGDAGALDALRADVVRAGTALVDAARAGDAAAALRALPAHRLLVAHRRGPAGLARWEALARGWVDAATGGPAGPWAPGRPVTVTANDTATGLANGDLGVVVEDDGPLVAFGDPDAPQLVRPHLLPAAAPADASTVHRAQGGQHDRVALVLPPEGSPLLTRELLYTAVTRARHHVRILATDAAVRRAITSPTSRTTGLHAPR